MTTDERFDRIDDQLAGIRKDIAELLSYTRNFRIATIGQFENMDKRLEFMGISISTISMSLAGVTKAMLELQKADMDRTKMEMSKQ